MDETIALDAPAPTTTVRLPIGLVGADGVVCRDVALRKLRGSDEALFYDTSLNASQLVSELLRACVMRVGHLGPLQPRQLDEMYSADRNFLLFALRRITFGDEWRALYACPACDGGVRVEEDLASFAVRVLPDAAPVPRVEIELEDGYRDRSGVTHRRLVLRLPRGADEAFVAALAESDVRQARDALLVRCIAEFGTLTRAPLESFGVKILRDLTLGDRRRIQRALDEAAPGVDFRRTVRCPHCALEFDAIADVTDFFEVS